MEKGSYRLIINIIAMIVLTALLYILSDVFTIDKIDVEDKLTKISDNGIRAEYLLDIKKPTDDVYYLNLKTHGSVVRVISNDKIIYEYGSDYKNQERMIGKTFSNILLPENAYDGNIHIEIVASDTNGTTNIETAELCTETDRQWYYVTNETLGGLIGPIFVTIALLFMVIAIFVGLDGIMGKRSLAFGLIILCMAGEVMDTGGHYLMFIRNQYAWNIYFQFNSLLLPIFTLLFYSLVEKNPISRKAAKIGTIINALLVALVPLVVNVFRGYKVSDFASLMYIEFAVDAVVLIIGIYWLIKNREFTKQYMAVGLVIIVWFVVMLLLSTVQHTISKVMNRSVLDLETVTALFILFVLSYIFVSIVQKEYYEKKELEARLHKMQVQNFNSQMQPHFLYNALGSIQQIIYEDADYAAKLLNDFTVHLRGTIRSMSNDSPIHFSQEIKNIKAYVNIEKVRFDDKLTVDYDIQAFDFMIMPLSIQPIVENAIKHGIYDRGKKGGHVLIKSYETDDKWVVQVIDDGVGFDFDKIMKDVEDGVRDSTGLKNLIFRLEKLMGAEVDIDSTIDVGTTVTVLIPKQNEVFKCEQ